MNTTPLPKNEAVAGAQVSLFLGIAESPFYVGEAILSHRVGLKAFAGKQRSASERVVVVDLAHDYRKLADHLGVDASQIQRWWVQPIGEEATAFFDQDYFEGCPKCYETSQGLVQWTVLFGPSNLEA